MSRLVVVDVETTGLKPAGARVIEVAAVEIINGKIGNHFQSLVRSCKTVPAEVVRITGITGPMLSKAPAPREVFEGLLDFIGGAPQAAHNAEFDAAFLNAETRALGLPLDDRFLCTLAMARRLYKGPRNFKLETIAKYLFLPRPDALHRALANAALTARLLIQMQSDIAARWGTPVPELRHAAELSAGAGAVCGRAVGGWLSRAGCSYLILCLAGYMLFLSDGPRRSDWQGREINRMDSQPCPLC